MRFRDGLWNSLPVAFLLIALAPARLEAAGPLVVSPVNPRYFTDDPGRAVFLTGSHTWTNFLDAGNGYPPPIFDYAAYLDFLEQHGHNFFRLWVWENSRWMLALPDDDFWLYPGPPWERTGPGLAADGLPRFDLERPSQPYFDRLHQRCLEAQARGFYVSVMLFDGFSVAKEKGGMGLQNPWHGHPFRAGNNINGVSGDTNGDDSGEETHELGNPVVLALQEAYVRRVIDSVNDLDNILYEISNESHSEATAWQYHMIDLIHSYEATLPERHPVGLTVEYPGGDNGELYASEAEWISPNGPLEDRPLSDGTKVILADTDHLCGICGSIAFVWKSFLRGENPIFMDDYGGPEWDDVRRNLGYARLYAERVDLLAMTPTTNLASTGYCLAHPEAPGAEYLVFSEGGSFTIDLRGTSGTLEAEWFSPADGSTYAGAAVEGGAIRLFSAPFGGEAVLYLYSSPESSTVGCSYAISPPGGTIPFATQHAVTMTNQVALQTRRLAGRIDVRLAQGQFYSNWRSGFTNLVPLGQFGKSWILQIPALGSVIGENLFTLHVLDVTPSPYNQPPYPPAGDSCAVTNTVTAALP